MSGMDLVEFLKARFDEDEQLALAAEVDFDMTRVLADVKAKRAIIDHHRVTTFTDVSLDIRGWTVCAVCHCVMDEPEDWDETKEWTYPFVQYQFPCPTLRLLAQPYSNHPDYREEWQR